jgi:hypothetical protein
VEHNNSKSKKKERERVVRDVMSSIKIVEGEKDRTHRGKVFEADVDGRIGGEVGNHHPLPGGVIEIKRNHVALGIVGGVGLPVIRVPGAPDELVAEAGRVAQGRGRGVAPEGEFWPEGEDALGEA